MMQFEQLTVQSANALFRLFNNLSNVVFWVRSHDYQQQLFLSQGFEAVWGQSCQAIYEQPARWFDTVVPEPGQDRMACFKKRAEQGYAGTVLFRIQRPDGEQCWIKDQSCALVDAQQQPLAVIGVGECLSEGQHEALLQKPHLLQAANDGLSDFVGLLCQAYTAKAVPLVTASKAPAETGRYINCNNQRIWVSRREWQALEYLLKGQSAKQTAFGLKISTRTVESYLDNLRKKTGCRTKLALIGQLAKQL